MGLVRGTLQRVIIRHMIKSNVTLDGFQQARDAVQQALREVMSDSFVLVGIHEDKSQRSGGEINNATLGAVHEFGTDNIPARPWLNPGVASGEKEYLNIIERTLNNGEELDVALERIGVVAVGKVQKYMRDLRTPPNKPSTIKRKGSSNPLIDTGVLRQSVTYKVTRGKPTEGL